MSALRKAGVWLGLIEDDDDRAYEDERYAGIFGEREFMEAVFPGYLKQLNPQVAAMTGKLKFKPMDMGLAMKLGKLLA